MKHRSYAVDDFLHRHGASKDGRLSTPDFIELQLALVSDAFHTGPRNAHDSLRDLLRRYPGGHNAVPSGPLRRAGAESVAAVNACTELAANNEKTGPAPPDELEEKAGAEGRLAAAAEAARRSPISCIGVWSTACIQKAGNMSNGVLIDCHDQEAAAWDKRLNVAYVKASSRMEKDALDNLRKVQRAWIAWRDATCAQPYLVFQGTMAGPDGFVVQARFHRPAGDLDGGLDEVRRRRSEVLPAAAGRAESVRPKARTMRITVPNSGLPVSPSALYRFSRFKPALFAISLMPRARATRPRASRTKSASPVSSAAVDIGHLTFLGVEIVGGVKSAVSTSQGLRQHLCAFDVAGLRALVAAAHQDHDLRSAMQIVDAVSWPREYASPSTPSPTLLHPRGFPVSMRRMRPTTRATALASLRPCSQAENSSVWRTSTIKLTP